MKVVLWAGIMVNGFYPQYPTVFQTPAEIWDDFYGHVAQAGNVIFGRRTAEEVWAAGVDDHYAQVDVVAVCRQATDLPGAHCVASPRQALAALAEKGHETAFVGGGNTILNGFLADDLADELIFVIAPAIGGCQFSVALPEGPHKDLRLQSVKEIGSGCVKLHYLLERGQ